MLGGLRELLPWRRATMLLAAPFVVCLCGTVGTALALPSSSATPHDAARHHAALRVAAAGRVITPEYLRSLPHDARGNIGAPRFRTRPPRHLNGHTLAAAAIPGIAISAYQHAASVLASGDPACHLAWYDLAGIGRVESDNGLTWGPLARVSPNGTLSPPILGPILDGRGGMPGYPSPDHGRLEHGGRWERAVGPMQFLPSTWLEYAQDGNGDGVKNPQNYWDAALTTAAFLCANGGNLSTSSGFTSAVYAYNHSSAYVALVRSWARFYARAGAGHLAAPSSVLPVGFAALPTSHGSPTTAGPSALAVLLHAVAVTERSGTYSFSFDLLSGGLTGQSIGQGAARVDARTGNAVTTLEIPGTGLSTICVLAGRSGPATYVQLPNGLDADLGEPARSWLAVTPALRSAASVAHTMAEVVFTAAWLRSSIAGFAGATTAEGVVARGPVAGVPTVAYGGPLALSAAAGRDPMVASDLDEIEQLIGSSTVSGTAWVDRRGLVRQASVVVPRVTGLSSAAVGLVVRYGAFGLPIALPAVRPVPYPASTTTTSPGTTSSSSTTSTSSTTTSTSSTTTTSTTTTSTLPIPSSTSPTG